MVFSIICNYCPSTIYGEVINGKTRYFNDPLCSEPHRHSTNKGFLKELEQIKKIQKSLLMKVQYMYEDLKIIKVKLGLNDVR